MTYNKQMLDGIKFMKNQGLSTMCNSVWGAVWENGDTEKCDHTQCFGASRMSKYKGCSWIVSRIQDNGAAGTRKFESDLVQYYDWLFNESPWAKVFVTKSGQQAVDERWLVAQTDIPANMLIGALQASRIPTEYSNSMFVMNDLAKVGCPRNLGFLIGMCLAGGDKRSGSASWGDTTREHTCLSSNNLSATTMQNFIDGKAALPNKHYKVHTSYTLPNNVNHIWGIRKDREDMLPDFLNKNFDADTILNGADTVESLNPFAIKDSVQAGMVSYDDAIKAMGMWYGNVIKEFELDV